MEQQRASIESPFVLAYLASGTILDSVRLGMHAVNSDKTVSSTDLAAAPFVATLYDLRDRGALSLKLTTGKILFVTTHSVEIARNAAEVPAYNGAAGRVYAATAKAKKPDGVVSAWFGGVRVRSPWSVVVQSAFDEAAALGAAQPAPHTKLQALGAGLMGMTRAQFTDRPDVPDAVAAFAQRWQGWAAADPELHKHLMKGIASGIAAMKEPDDTDTTTFSND